MATEEQVRALVLGRINCLGIKEVPSDTDTLYDLNIDSLDCVDIVSDVEYFYDITIDDSVALQKACSGTVGELIAFLIDSVNKLKKQ